MNDWIRESDVVVEIGAGAGFSELYLNVRPLLTDAVPNPWIDEVVDALAINKPDESIDVIIASHTIHHFATPALFFDECKRILKPGGKILIQEINTSLFMRLLLRVMRHEGWSYSVDVFNRETISNDPRDPWSANCAIPELFFSKSVKFEDAFGLIVKQNTLNECLAFPLSGGVIAKTKVPKLPLKVLAAISIVDKILVALIPNLFALGRSVVLEKPASRHKNRD